jgi:CHAT domain
MKKNILVIASNPQDTTSLRLDRELRVINEVIQKSQLRDRFDVHQLWAARTIDLIDALLKYKPRIVHFCGHGEGQMGLVLEDEAGKAKPVSSEALAEVFKNLAAKVECVLLNACYSDVQADAIVEHINYVIGMSREIRDDAAIAFTRGFYTALGNGEPIKNAYDFGKSQVAIEISSDTTIDSRKLTSKRPADNIRYFTAFCTRTRTTEIGRLFIRCLYLLCRSRTRPNMGLGYFSPEIRTSGNRGSCFGRCGSSRRSQDRQYRARYSPSEADYHCSLRCLFNRQHG